MDAQSSTASLARVKETIKKIQDYLLSIQHPDGYWECELVVDSTVVCDYVLYHRWAKDVDVKLEQRCVQHILRRQLEDGGWPQFPGGPAELNATIKGYYALKLAGESLNAPHMVKARDQALSLGGIPKMHTWGKLYLAMLGLFPWKYCPLIPAETIILPKWFPINIYRLSSWTRNMFVPLAIINHYKPVRLLEECPDLNELYPEGTMEGDWSLAYSKKLVSWKNFFLSLDKIGRFLNHLPVNWFRRRALKAAESWMFDRIGHGSDGLGAIFPSMMNVLIAMECMGYPKTHPLFVKAKQDFEGLVRGDDDDVRVAPCFSPVWDTAIIAMALADSGYDCTDPRMVQCADWLLDREIGIRGDWKENCDFSEAAGWAFEFNNDWYPDVDDSFQVILGLQQLTASDDTRRQVAIDRGMRWCRAMQCKEGGFAAFDKDVTDAWLNHVPFADHNAILDPPCSDITGRALETHGRLRYPVDDNVVASAKKFLIETQEVDGSWFGRWGINYIYGTGHAVRGLQAIGEDMTQPYLQKARNWLENCQNEDGGWGESAWTYHAENTRGQGPSTASQTAWALLGLLSFGDPHRPSIRRGIEQLQREQQADGSWTYDAFTGTGFPQVFYLKYTSYQWSWPLAALAAYVTAIERKS